MALVSITEAANLARKNQADLYRDIDDGRVQATRTAEGELLLDTEELKRIYQPEAAEELGTTSEKVKIAVLEERTRSLERALALEAELRKVKDQVASELRARLADKDNVIKVLESKVLFLEYDRQIESLEPDEKTEARETEAGEDHHEGSNKRWWARIFDKGNGSSLPR
jgi:hypothetical protein